MKKLLLITSLLPLSFSYSQEKQAFTIDEFQLFTGFNNVTYNDNYNFTETAHTIFEESKNHQWKTNLSPEPLDDLFPELKLPSFYINGIAGKKLSIPNLSWRFGLNLIHSTMKLVDVNEHGYSDHSYVFDDSGTVLSYTSSNEYIYCNMLVNNLKFSIENALYFRTGDANSRRSAYFGLSTQIGINRSEYDYTYRMTNTEYQVSAGDYQKTSENNYEFIELRKGKPGLYTSLNLLIGFDQRLGKKKFRKTHLFTEFKPGTCIFYSPELNSWKSTYNGFWSLIGFRYTFDGNDHTEK